MYSSKTETLNEKAADAFKEYTASSDDSTYDTGYTYYSLINKF